MVSCRKALNNRWVLLAGTKSNPATVWSNRLAQAKAEAAYEVMTARDPGDAPRPSNVSSANCGPSTGSCQ